MAGIPEYRTGCRRDQVVLEKAVLYSLEGITGFSVAPLALASIAGVAFCFLAFLMIVVIIIKTLLFGDPVSGWPSLACLIFFVSGIQLFCTGIVGQYLSKTYLETKTGQFFILKESSEKADGCKKPEGIPYEAA